MNNEKFQSLVLEALNNISNRLDKIEYRLDTIEARLDHVEIDLSNVKIEVKEVKNIAIRTEEQVKRNTESIIAICEPETEVKCKRR